MDQIKVIWSHKREIHYLAVEKIRMKYNETFLGLIWAVVQPMVYVMTFWFFFTVGLRSGSPVKGYDFLLWLIGGVMSFRILSEAITASTTVLTGNVVFIKSIKFPVMLLPIIEMLSKMYVHIGVMILIWIFYLIRGGLEFAPDIYYINFLYYWFVMFAFLVAVSILLSSLNVIIRDTKNLVSAIMMPMFWITPVLWEAGDGWTDLIMKLINPLYFFVLGYRDTLLFEKFFWEEIWYDFYIWIVILLIFGIGTKLWKNVRPVMADYL